MRIVLQNCETGFYYAGCRKWIDDVDRAFNFEKTAAAIAFVQKLPKPEELQVIMCFDDTNYDYWLGSDELGGDDPD
jgi:hypothetical protein